VDNLVSWLAYLESILLRRSIDRLLANNVVVAVVIAAEVAEKKRTMIIQHTMRYTELAPGRFKGFWR
jgi:hypothetical protein